jgi:hypothetical protein
MLLPLCLVIPCAVAQNNNPRLEALKKYVLQQDYPEVFKTNYRTRIEDVLDVDVDNDGEKEFVVLYFPHFRQSAPIIVYKMSSDLKVSRVKEGLAPGPLMPISGEYLDAHSLGLAADLDFPDDSRQEAFRKIMASNSFNGFVAYDTFYHMDLRRGGPWFIDMRGVKVPGNSKDCSAFEFSRVKQIAAGGVREDATKNYLAAWVGDSIDVYLIAGVSREGIFDKKQWVLPTPPGFKGFDPGGGLAYTTASGTAILSLK